jgi:tetratricopeptide (TPR) repeat protein
MLATLALALALAQAPAAASAADPEIAFWAARVERDQDDHVSATKLGYACLNQARRTGDFRLYARAEGAFTEALKRSPGHFSALLGQATARSARHRFRDAIDLARQAAAAQPGDAEPYAIIGDASLGLGDLIAAEAAYKELAGRAPGFAADTRMANLLQARGRSRDAVALLRRALDEATAKDLPVESRSWSRVMIGATLFDLGDWEAAEPEYRAALDLTPDSYVAIEHLAELRSYQRRDAEAIALYERAMAIAPHPDFFEAVARTFERAGRPGEAKPWHARARDGYLEAVKAGDPGYYRHLAMFFTDIEKRPDAAVEWARRDLELRQDHAAWSTLAWALHGTGDVAGARAASDKAIATGAEDALMWFHAGLIEKAAGNGAAAREKLSRALAINPRFDGAGEARALLNEIKKN